MDRSLTGFHITSWSFADIHLHPGLCVQVQDHMTIATDEIFGPVQSILKFKTIDEVRWLVIVVVRRHVQLATRTCLTDLAHIQ